MKPGTNGSHTMQTIDLRGTDLRFLTPPGMQGQTIEVAYAAIEDGMVLERTTDRSTGETQYHIAEIDADRCEESVGLNERPFIVGKWAKCIVRE